MGFQATDFAASQVNPMRLALISIGSVLVAAILGVDKCFVRWVSQAKILLRENGSDLGH